MAIFHFTVTQTKRSKGQSAIASAAYRSGERLYSEYYGEYSDYTRKGGVICSDILLPSHAPKEYADRQTLWNAVEKAERGKTAQLAYSFEISLQNEFSLEENIALARKFLLEQFVSRGMTVDVSFHEKEHEDGGTPNPHFHFLCPIRPIEQDGTWGLKQRRVYALDEDGNRIRDQNGEFVFNAVPTTDWGSPETLEHWRQTWAEMCNAKFAEKGLDVRIDHRSYERQGVDLLPTIHEGATVRAMEKKGIRTEKGEFNRWIRATNAVIRDIKKKIASLIGWIADMKAELSKPQAPDLVSLLNAYYTQRRAGAYSQKGKVSNLKEMNETFNYLRANGIYSLEDLEHRVSEHSAATESLKKTLDEQTARMKAIKQLYDSSAAFQSLKPVYDGLQKTKFEKPRAKYKAEHEAELKQFYAARRKLTGEFPDGKDRIKFAWEQVIETAKKVAPYVLIGVGIGAFIHDWIPEDFIVKVLGTGNPFGVILATIAGVPMYADIFGTIPIAEALLAKGAQLGVVLSFMMGVTTLSLPSVIMLRKAVKPKLLGIFIAICTVGIIIVGYFFNAISYLLI